MDDRLVNWARAVKSRRRWSGLAGRVPPLWLFTDAVRMPDLPGVVAALPIGLCGVVFRHDGAVGRGGLAEAVWRICRMRRLAMVVGGDPVGFVGPGVHLRGGRGPGGRALRTASAHDRAELVRARRAGACLVFVSPVFVTASHVGSPGLGAVRWAGVVRAGGVAVAALGGVDGRSVLRLPRRVAGAGAIGALIAG